MTKTKNPYLDKPIDTSFLLNPLLLSIQAEFEPHNPDNFKNRYLTLRDNKTKEIRIVVHSHQSDGRLNSQTQEHKAILDQYLLGRGQTLADYTLDEKQSCPTFKTGPVILRTLSGKQLLPKRSKRRKPIYKTSTLFLIP